MTGVSSIQQSFDSPGWCLVRSAVLQETVLWIRDERTPFPRQPKGRVVYTLAELDLLLDREATVADLRTLHAIKRTFQGAVAAHEPVRQADPTEGWGEAPPPAGAPPPSAASAQPDPFADWG